MLMKVSAIQSNPNTDPHEFEVTPSVARSFHRADLVVENGLGYDSWAAEMLEGTHAKLLSAQKLLNLQDDAPNPHYGTARIRCLPWPPPPPRFSRRRTRPIRQYMRQI
jgi:Zinc-uptake complex component A periplasmic